MKHEQNKVKGERNVLQGENDRAQGENKSFGRVGKKVPKGGEKKGEKQHCSRVKKKGAPIFPARSQKAKQKIANPHYNGRTITQKQIWKARPLFWP